MSYRKLAGWGSVKPPQGSAINWGDPITRGLLFRCLFNGARSRGIDLARNKHMTGYSGVTISAGKFGACPQFDGVAGKYRVELEGAKAIVNAPPFTVSGWMCGTDATAVFMFCVADEGTNLASYRIQSTSGSGGVFRAQVADSVGSDSAQATTTMTTGVWYHVVGVFASITDRRIYINGRLEATNTTSVNPTAANITSTCVGVFNRQSFIFGTGKVDNLGIWNRVLSGAEILRLYNDPFTDILQPLRPVFSPPPPFYGRLALPQAVNRAATY